MKNFKKKPKDVFSAAQRKTLTTAGFTRVIAPGIPFEEWADLEGRHVCMSAGEVVIKTGGEYRSIIDLKTALKLLGVKS